MIALALRFWYLIVIAALLAALGAQTLRLSNAHEEFAQYKLEQANLTREAERAAREREQKQQRDFDDAAQAAREENDALQKDVARLADQSDGLRDDLAAFKRRASCNTQPKNGSKGQPSADPLDLLIGVYQRADREAGILAEYAEKLRSAGVACERSADSLVLPNPNPPNSHNQ